MMLNIMARMRELEAENAVLRAALEKRKEEEGRQKEQWQNLWKYDGEAQRRV